MLSDFHLVWIGWAILAVVSSVLWGWAIAHLTLNPSRAPQINLAVQDRKRLDPRREGVRETIAFEFSGKMRRTFDVTFNRDAEGVVREVFCAGAHTQSDLQGLIEDSCIALSIALQHGARIADIAKSFGELRDESASDGPPASPLGTIARVGARIEAQHQDGHDGDAMSDSQEAAQ